MTRRDWGTIDRLLDEVERVGWRGGNQVIAAAFAIATNEHFATAHSPTGVARFVAETRSRFPAAQSLPKLEMEALIRAAPGKVDLIDDLSPETALQIQVVFLGKLLQDDCRTEPELEAFIADAERTAADYL